MSREKQGGCGCETCRNGDDQWCCESCHSLAKQMSPAPVPSEVAETTAGECVCGHRDCPGLWTGDGCPQVIAQPNQQGV